MPLITEREKVLAIYREAAENRWVIPCFCSENLTTTEAVLAGVKEYGDKIGRRDLPVVIALTNRYRCRSQSEKYTHTGRWDIGLKLFMSDLAVLGGGESPFADINIMIHLDHIQYDLDGELLSWDMRNFSSIMFDASRLSLDENIELTKKFVETHRKTIVIEGACDEIVDAAGDEKSKLTNPKDAKIYKEKTGVDLVVANLGTEHRASAAELIYNRDRARAIKSFIGQTIVLHGTSSVPREQMKTLFADGVCKVNIWTSLERDSSPPLFINMVENAARITGPDMARKMVGQQLLGEKADLSSRPEMDYFTTHYRQSIIFAEMKKIVKDYLSLWYR